MIEYIKTDLKEIIEKYFLDKYNLEINIVIEEPKKKELGDLSIPSFVVVKALRRPLNDCVNEIVVYINSSCYCNSDISNISICHITN